MNEKYEDKVVRFKVIEFDGNHVDDWEVAVACRIASFGAGSSSIPNVSCHPNDPTLYTDEDNPEIKPGDHIILIDDVNYTGSFSKPSRPNVYTFICKELSLKACAQAKNEYMTALGY